VLVVLLAVGLLGAGCGGATKAAVTVRIDPRAAYQQIQGFGISERVWNDPHLSRSHVAAGVPPSAQRSILEALFGDLGLTRLRPILDRGLVEPVNDNGSPQRIRPGGFHFAGQAADAHIALVREAERYGLRTFFPAPVFLERWMTDANPDEAAEWAFAMLQHWRELGTEPPFYSPLNEPQTDQNRSPEWLRRMVIALGERMRKAGLRTKLVIPDDLNAHTAYSRAAAVLADPEARQYVGAVAYHFYGGEQDLSRMRELAGRYGLPVWMTEYSFRSLAHDGSHGSLAWAIDIQRLLTQGGVSAVDYLWGFFGSHDRPATLISIDFDDGVYRGYSTTPLYDVMRQFSRFVRPGYRRIAATPNRGDLLTSAFRGPGRMVVVAVNRGAATLHATFEVSGSRLDGLVRAVRTSATERSRELEPIPPEGSRFSADLPGKSVTTFVLRTNT
jgi:O-glycosyl hydrolase